MSWHPCSDMASAEPFCGSRAPQRYAWKALDFHLPKRLGLSKSGAAWHVEE